MKEKTHKQERSLIPSLVTLALVKNILKRGIDHFALEEYSPCIKVFAYICMFGRQYANLLCIGTELNKFMNNSVHIILWLRWLRCNTYKSKHWNYIERCQAALQSCPDTFQMFDESSGGRLHAGNTVGEKIAVCEEYIVSLNKVKAFQRNSLIDWAISPLWTFYERKWK